MKNILIISSRPPEHSAGLGQSIMDCLITNGCSVDFLTPFSYNSQSKNVIPIFNTRKKYSVRTELRYVLKKFHLYNLIRSIAKYGIKLFHIKQSPYITNNGITIKYPDENKPDIPIPIVLKKISKSYDAVITLFWQDMINSSTLKAIYDKLKSPILIYSPDMSPMTGGCFYFGHCRNFKYQCGCCPGLNSENTHDQSNVNYLIKKENYSLIKCAFLGNSWMNQFAKESGMFKYIFKTEIIIDSNIFKPLDCNFARKQLGISTKKDYILLVRSDSHPRKGNDDIVKALKLFNLKITESDRSKIIIISIGEQYFPIISQDIGFEILNLGVVPLDKLILCYQSANYFVNTSRDDAGPSMINQSIMCGTPVICYDSGSAIDVIENEKSGYKVDVGNIDGLSSLLLYTYKLDYDKYLRLCKQSREIALLHNSSDAIYKSFEFAYNHIANELPHS